MAGEQRPTPFLTKTCQLVNDPAVDGLISWNYDGTKFIVWQQREFARDLLPQYFKHSNFTSFVRQLNTYGFKKVRGERGVFFHKLFQRGKEDQLHHIKRKISRANTGVKQVIPLSCAAVQELRDEIEKLKKETETLKGVNVQMSHELSQLSELCKVKWGVKSEPSECRDFLRN